MFRRIFVCILACLPMVSVGMAQPVVEAPMPERGAPPPLRFSTHWGQMTNSPPTADEGWQKAAQPGVTVNPYTQARYFPQAGGGWMRIGDTGSVYIPAPPNLPEPKRLIFEFDHDDRIYAQKGGFIVVSDDLGRSWTPISMPAEITEVLPLAVRNDGQTQLLLAGAEGLWIGTGEIQDGTPEFVWRHVLTNAITALAVSHDQSTVVAGKASGEVVVGHSVEDEWVFPGRQPREAAVAFTAIHPSDPDFLVAGYREPRGDTAGALVYLSRDAGDTWEPADGVSPGRLPDDPPKNLLFVFYDQEYLAYLLTANHTYVTQDFLTWGIEESMPEATITGVFAQDNTMYAGGPGQAWYMVPQAVRCTYQVTPTKITASPEGSTHRLAINANSSTCAWSVSKLASNSPIRISSGASGRGDGSVTFTVAANQTSRKRTLSLRVANRSVSISQGNIEACSVALRTGSNWDLPSGNKSGFASALQIGVSANLPNCEWAISADSPELTFAPAAGRGSATVTASLKANHTGKPRRIVTTFQGRQYTLVQAAERQEPGSGNPVVPCSVQVNSARFPATGGTGSLRVQKTGTCDAITLTAASAWISLEKTAVTANGVADVSFRVAAHTTTGDRTAAINATAGGSNLNGSPVTITQTGAKPEPCTRITATAAATSVAAAGGRIAIAIHNTGACPASTARTDQGWARVVASAGGFTIEIDRNAGAARAVTVTITNASRTVGGSPIRLQQTGVSQPRPPQPQPCVITLPVTYVELAGSTRIYDIRVNTSRADCAWSVSPVSTTATDTQWLALSRTAGTGTGIIRLTAKSPGIQGRLAEFRVANIPVTVTQRGTIGSNGCACVGPACGANMQMSIDRSSFAASGGDTSLKVFAPNSCQWEVHASDAFVSFPSGNRGIGNGVVAVRVAPNRLGVSRTTEIRSPQATPAVNGSVAKARLTQSAN